MWVNFLEQIHLLLIYATVINQLAELFFNLEYCESAAVTPSIELAKLALVTSRDEEEDEADKGGTDSSNDTDATLVDDAPARIVNETTTIEIPRSPSRSPNSVLGKRARDVERQPSAMDLDPPSPPRNPDHFGSSPMRGGSDSPPPLVSPGSPYGSALEASGSESLLKIDNDVEMRGTPAPEKKPPPLPPRKATTSDSVMMFGTTRLPCWSVISDAFLCVQASSMTLRNAWIIVYSKSRRLYSSLTA